MTETFTSVTLFYAALRRTLLASPALTIERTLGSHDVIFTCPAGFARFRMAVVSPAISAVCLEFGTDADALTVSTDSPECCFPFDTTDPASFGTEVHWNPDTSTLNVRVWPLNESSTRSYRVGFDFVENKAYISHEDPPNMTFFPDFHASGGPYIKAGV